MKLVLRSSARSWLVVLFLLGAVLWWAAFAFTFTAIPYNDAMDYASIGLNIAGGKGIVSSYLTPLSLGHVGEPYPNIWRAPLWSLVLAAGFLLADPTDMVVALVTGFFYLATILPLFLLADRLGNRTVAVGTVVIYLTSPVLLHFSSSGMTEPMAAFFLVGWFYLLYRGGETGRSWWYFAMLGIVTGLFYLARYNALVFLPVSLGYLWLAMGGKKGKAGGGRESCLKLGACYKLGIYLAAWLVTVGPWLVRNILVAGSPFFSLQSYELAMFTPTYPDYTLYMLADPVNVKEFVLQHWPEVAAKIGSGVAQFGADFFQPQFSGLPPWLVGLAMLGLVLPQRRDQFAFKWFVASCYVIQLGSLWVVHYIPRLFVMFIPVLVLFGLMTLWQLTSLVRRRVLRQGILVLAVALAVGVNPFPWEEANSWHDWPKEYAGAIADSRELFRPGEVIVSNDGHLLAWYAGRTALKLPVHPDQLAELMERAPVQGIFLSNRLFWRESNTPEADPVWAEYMLAKKEIIGVFRLVRIYDNHSMLYVRDK